MRKVHNENVANGDADEILKECLQCHRVTSLTYVEFLYIPLGKGQWNTLTAFKSILIMFTDV